jgi:glutaconyl-CoA/methylmalonyl-CoA decarboxylase subunit gamma
MIVKVKIEEQIYQVEISDIQQRPIIAIVDGDEFEIWPEGEPVKSMGGLVTDNVIKQYHNPPGAVPTGPVIGISQKHDNEKAIGHTPPATNGTLLLVRAPIPGVITAVDVQAGSEVSVGQQLCVLEAMKMNNSIRASRAGRISVVHITTGQHVKHHDVLIEYAD